MTTNAGGHAAGLVRQFVTFLCPESSMEDGKVYFYRAFRLVCAGHYFYALVHH